MSASTQHLFTVGSATLVRLSLTDVNGNSSIPRNAASGRLVLREGDESAPVIELVGAIDGDQFEATPTQAQVDALNPGIFIAQLRISLLDNTHILSNPFYAEVKARVA